jgi:hypothetical protein
MRFAKLVFLIAGIYGIVTIAPQYFLRDAIVRAGGPMTHVEYFYGFLGVCLTWQILFVVISAAPTRLRPAMPVAVLEKLSFAIPVLALYAKGQLNAQLAVFGGIDLLWAVLFTIATLKTQGASGGRG